MNLIEDIQGSMGANSVIISWPWVVLRNVLTLSFCVVGGGLLWAIKVGGFPLATSLWVGVVVGLQVLLIRFQHQPWLGLNIPTRWELSKDGAVVPSSKRQWDYPVYLMILDDILPILLFGWALIAGVYCDEGALHYGLTFCLVALIGCSLPVKSRLGQRDGDDHRTSEPNP